ncbi:MAG: DUF4153 domain-containing protein [Candidatus Gracilibacteria bacterium]
MKNIFSMFSMEALKTNIRTIISRFTISIIIIFIVSVLFFINIHAELVQSMNEELFRIITSLIVTFFFSIGIYLGTESSSYSKLKKTLFQLIPLGFGVLLYSVFSSDFNDFENILFIIISFFGIIFYLFFAPYLKNILKNNTKQTVFYTYFYNISVLFLISFILGGVLYGLGMIGITTVFELFDIREFISNDIYSDWATLALAFFTPLFALTKIPNKKSFNENHFNENVFFSFLIKYIAIPFIYIYFIILYAYTVKVLSNFGDWPKGEVSWIVIGFSIFGYITYIFSYIFEEKNKAIRIFRKFFPFVVIPQIFMLFYAIYLRISQYDITINRYLVVIFGAWLLIISLYYVFSKKKFLPIIPFLLTVFTIIISVGPWSVHNLPEDRQLDRLENNLIKANILKDGVVTPLNSFEDIDKDLSKNIYSGIDYLCDFDNCNTIKELFPVIYKEIEDKDKLEWEKNKKEDIARYEEAIIKYAETDKERVKNNEKILKERLVKKYDGVNRWKIVTEITKKIKVEHYFNNNERRTIYINSDKSNGIFPINIEGYSKILRLENNNYDNSNFGKINLLNKNIEIISDGKVLETINIEKILEEITKKYTDSGVENFSKEDLAFEVNGKDNAYKIIFENLNLPNPEYKGKEADNGYYYAGGYLLVK